MGGVKQMQIEAEESNYGNIKETYVCSRHIDDYAIIRFVKKNGNQNTCSYCLKKRNVIPLNKLMSIIVDGINNVYEDAANWMWHDSREGGYLGTTYNNYEIITDLLDIDDVDLQDDIIDGIADIAWSTRFDYLSTESDLLHENWQLFKDVSRHKSRYMFTKTSLFKTSEDNKKVYDIFESIKKGVRPLKLIDKIPKNTELYRIRHHSSNEKVDYFTDIASTSIEKSKFANRMSPAGIPMFYCSFDYDTSYKETVDLSNKQKKKVTCGIFKNKKELKVINFSRLKGISFFDIEKRKYYELSLFLQSFVRDLSKSIDHDGREHIEYVPTQVVTEFFRFPFSESIKQKIDGIIYPSSKNFGKNACVLFFDDEECIEELDLINMKTTNVK